MIASFRHNGHEWFWNPFFGFFFQPVSLTRKRERIIREGCLLYDVLRQSAKYP